MFCKQPRESSAMGPAKVNCFLAKMAVSGTRNFRQPSYIYIYIHVNKYAEREREREREKEIYGERVPCAPPNAY